jgi:hypothetical protein
MTGGAGGGGNGGKMPAVEEWVVAMYFAWLALGAPGLNPLATQAWLAVLP